MALGYQQNWIKTSKELQEVVSTLIEQPCVSFDTEFVRRSTYYPQFGLLQLASGAESYVLDPLEVTDIAALKNLLTSKRVVKTSHSSRQDVDIFIHALECIPTPLADTQILAEFCGFSENISLQALCQTFFNVELSKEFQRLNWMMRPLPKAAVTYALEDAEYIYQCHARLKARAGPKYQWFQEDMRVLCEPLFYEETPEKLLSKFKKPTSSLKDSCNSALTAILVVRNWVASQLNVLTKDVLTDDQCYELCQLGENGCQIALEKALNEGINTLKRVRKHPKTGQKTAFRGPKNAVLSPKLPKIDTILELREKIRDTFQKSPSFKCEPEGKPFKKQAVMALQSTIQKIAEVQEISPTLLARSRDIKAHLAGKPSRLTQGWRGKVLKGIL